MALRTVLHRRRCRAQVLCLAATTTPSGAGCTCGSSSWQHTPQDPWQVCVDCCVAALLNLSLAPAPSACWHANT